MVDQAGRAARSPRRRGFPVSVVVLAALLGPLGGRSPLPADDAPAPAVSRPFEAGDISIGEPIPLPFARAKAAAESAGQGAAATPGGAPAAGSGWLGITVAESKVPGRWIVDEVAPNGPASAAGIGAGDEVRAIGGLPLRNADDVAQALTSIAAGQTVNLAIGRGEQVSDVALTAVPRPTGLAKALQSMPRADSPPAALATLPPAAPAVTTVPPAPAALAPPATLPPVSTVAPPPESVTSPAAPAAVPATPPAAAFAAAPPVAAALPVATAPAVAPRFSRGPAAAESPAAPSERFSPAPPLAAAEPPPTAAQVPSAPQPLPSSGGRIALGVRTIPIDPGLQARFNLPAAAGAYVIGVVGDLPASRAGVPPGSVIVALDERPVRSPDELTRLVTSGPVGKPVPLEYVLPGGTSRRAEVVLQALEQPLEEALVGPVTPTPTPAPQFQPEPTPTRAQRPVIDGDSDLLRAAIRRLEARLESLERRLQDR